MKNIKELNELKIIQTLWCDGGYAESEELQEFLKDATIVATGLYVDKHRWYETAIDVYKVQDKLIGIRAISQLYSESSGIEDCFHYLRFMEMEEIKTTTYAEKLSQQSEKQEEDK
jgi:hypothetical protein